MVTLYLSNFLSLHVGDLSSYRVRNALNYVGILPSTIQAWHTIPVSVRSAYTLASFKHLLTLDTPKVPKYYCCGNRLNQGVHIRL